ncbi:35642_t:CDS:2, partial [Racocetra persica]
QSSSQYTQSFLYDDISTLDLQNSSVCFMQHNSLVSDILEVNTTENDVYAKQNGFVTIIVRSKSDDITRRRY